MVRVKVSDLGLTGNPTTDQIYEKANSLGLDLCPAEVGPYQRLADKDQEMNTLYWIAMKQITDSDGHPVVFRLTRGTDGSWLLGRWAGPDGRWRPGYRLVFSLRK